MELPIQYLYAIIGWVLWCTLHSVLISMTVMDYLKKRLGDGFRFYRVFYNTVAIATLIPLIHYSVSIRGESRNYQRLIFLMIGGSAVFLLP